MILDKSPSPQPKTVTRSRPRTRPAGGVAGAPAAGPRPASVPEAAAVFLGPRRGWVGTARGGRDSAPPALPGMTPGPPHPRSHPSDCCLVAAPQTTTRHYLFLSPWPPRGKNRKKKTTTHLPRFPPPLPEAGRCARSPGKGGPNMYFRERCGATGRGRRKVGGSPFPSAGRGGEHERGRGSARRPPGTLGRRLG